MINFLKKFLTLGLGKNPVSHWFWQRITAIIMILLFLWIFYSFQSLSNNFEESFYSWIKTPFNLFLFIILIIFTVHHSLLGMLNIFEDYIHSKKIKKISSVFLKLISFILISISIVSVYQIAQ